MRAVLGLGSHLWNFLGAALAACTTITLRIYFNQKQWDLKAIRTDFAQISNNGESPQSHFERIIHLDGALTEEQMVRLLVVANHCQVHLTLEAGSKIGTQLKTAVRSGTA